MQLICEMAGKDTLKSFELQQGLSYEMLQSILLILHKIVESEISALHVKRCCKQSFFNYLCLQNGNNKCKSLLLSNIQIL